MMNSLNSNLNELCSPVGDAENEENKGSVRVVSGSGFRYVVPFPWRLHQMLEDIEKAGEDGIVSWLPDGQHFQVHNPQLFVQRIIPKFFKQKSYKSFQRQLHLYGFQRVLEGSNRGAYFHESFQLEDRKLSLEITRIKAPKRRRPPPTKAMKPKLEEKCIDTAPSFMPSALERFQPFTTQQTESTSGPAPVPAGRLFVPSSASKPKAIDPVVIAFKKTCCHHHHVGAHASSCVSREPDQSPRETSVADTYEWLINAGVPFSAFDPVAIEKPQQTIGSDLMNCADEITSLFSSPTHKSTPAPEAALSLLSDCNDLSIEDAFTPANTFNDTNHNFPGSILDDLPPTVWGL